MTEKIFEAIREEEDVRKNLIQLRSILKSQPELIKEIDEDRKDLLVDLLSSEDAKTRKNAALILGLLKDQELLSVLLYAYRHEEKLFIRGDYLDAISCLDYSPVLDDLKKSLDMIEKTDLTEENRKHLLSEASTLRDMISRKEPHKKHRFTGWKKQSDMVLVVSPGMEDLCLNDLPREDCTGIRRGKGAVFLRTGALRRVLCLRTVKSFLFCFCANPLAGRKADEIAKEVLAGGIVDFLDERHESQNGPYYFRIDMYSHMVLEEKSRFVSRLAAGIESGSAGRLVNSVSDYELTIRLNENKAGAFSVYIQLETIEDKRFAYRKQAIATSLNPVRAAEICSTASGYLAGDAAVLDPFCGTGTLLIERNMRRRAKYLYGVDVYGQAVNMARQNAKVSGTDIFFINKDCLEFSHRYLFDEIITELPAAGGKMTRPELTRLYRGLAGRIGDWLKKGGYAIICTSQPEILLAALKRAGSIRVEQVRQLSGKRGDTIVICQLQ